MVCTRLVGWTGDAGKEKPVLCGWRPPCACGCGRPVIGRKDKAYATERCRWRRRDESRSVDLVGELAAMSDHRLRDTIRRALRQRHGEPPGGMNDAQREQRRWRIRY